MSQLDHDTERRALQTLVESEGWRVFLAHVGADWGDSALLSRLRLAVQGQKMGDEAAQHDAAARLLSAREAINAVLNWPQNRIRALEKVEGETAVGPAPFKRRA